MSVFLVSIQKNMPATKFTRPCETMKYRAMPRTPYPDRGFSFLSLEQYEQSSDNRDYTVRKKEEIKHCLKKWKHWLQQRTSRLK